MTASQQRGIRLALALGPARTRERMLQLMQQGEGVMERHWPQRQRYPAWSRARSIAELTNDMTQMLSDLDRLQAKEIFATDPDYPAALSRLPRAPSVLSVRGQLPRQDSVAIVGTRGARLESLEAARQIAADLARVGHCILSGGAIGVDAAAHSGALEAGGQTLAILGSGLDYLYPSRNLALFGRIASQGGLISPFSPGTPPRRHQFPLRNRLIAAMARAVVVIEAPTRSGALITAEWANRLGVPVLARQAGQGTLDLLHAGAGLINSAVDVCHLLRLQQSLRGRPLAAGVKQQSRTEGQF
jgi:DNA protecting protein DprA